MLLTKQQMESIRSRAARDYTSYPGNFIGAFRNIERVNAEFPVAVNDVHNLLAHIDALEKQHGKE